MGRLLGGNLYRPGYPPQEEAPPGGKASDPSANSSQPHPTHPQGPTAVTPPPIAPPPPPILVWSHPPPPTHPSRNCVHVYCIHIYIYISDSPSRLRPVPPTHWPPFVLTLKHHYITSLPHKEKKQTLFFFLFTLYTKNREIEIDVYHTKCMRKRERERERESVK